MNQQTSHGPEPQRDFERLKASLVSLISHELRTPLTYISASLEMLEIAYESPQMQSEIKRFLNIIDQGVKQLNTTIDELLMFSTLEETPVSKDKNPLQDLNVQQFLIEVLSVVKPTYQAKKQVLEVSIQEDMPPLRTDVSKFSEILLQLLSNAIKFTPTDGHLRIMAMQEAERLRLIISDTGPGMPPEVIAHIFDPFYQKEDYLIREHGGLGLGLTLVQKLCHSVNATLEIFPEEGVYTGTNFQIYIPFNTSQYEQGPELKKALDQMQALSQSNAEKEAQLNRLKSQLLRSSDELQRAYQHGEQKQSDLDAVYVEMMQGFAAALELRDPYTRGRSQRLAAYAQLLSKAAQLNEDESLYLYQACLLCDIGYIGISDEVLHKSHDRLTAEERQHVQSHPSIGAEMLQHIRMFKPILPLIRHSHENWDGSGYPDGLKGEKIPFASRVIRLVDAFDAMLSERSFRTGFSPEYVLQEIDRFAGSQFDPDLVTLFTRLWESGQLQPLIAKMEDEQKGVVPC